MKKILFGLYFVVSTWSAFAQDTPTPQYEDLDMTAPAGAWARMEVVNGDTTFVMSLNPVRIADKRKFKDDKEKQLFRRYTRAAKNMYQYAIDAVNMYNQVMDETEDMSKRKRKRYMRKEHRELKGDLEEKMKNLSVLEGKVLIKMIERQLNIPMHTVIKNTRGGVTAAYWNTLGKVNGYDLKAGYKLGEDPLLDEVLLDYNFGETIWLY